MAKIVNTGAWAPDNFNLSFSETGSTAGDKAYIVGADGRGLRQMPLISDRPWTSVWSPNQKSLYVSGIVKGRPIWDIWKWDVDSSNPEKLVDKCCLISDAHPSGNYLLGTILIGERTGIYEVSLSDRKCISLLPGVVTFGAVFARDGKSFLYAVASRGEVTIYRQPWSDGKIVGASQDCTENSLCVSGALF